MPVHAILHLGESPPLEIAVREEAWVGAAVSKGVALDQQASEFDVARAAAEALKSPLGFPPISQALVTGDRVAIAIGEGVREVPEVVRGLVAALEEAGASRDTISVVTGTTAEADRIRTQLEDLTSDGCAVVGHQARDKEELCFLAAVEDAPLLLNRHLFEADVVIPVGCARASSVRDARGPYESIYPRFSDAETQNRYAQADALDLPTAIGIRRGETDQAGWLLGALYVVQVVPGPGGRVAQVVAGAAREVEQAATEACANQWERPVEQQANLVVGTLFGGPEEQTWANVARALFSAAQVADPDCSAVAICTDLDVPPGETLQQLMSAGGDLERVAQLNEAQTSDAAAAWEIYKALCRGPVYFMSRLEDEVVEDLGMTPVANAAELSRLIERSDSCIVLDECQHAVPILVNGEGVADG